MIRSTSGTMLIVAALTAASILAMLVAGCAPAAPPPPATPPPLSPFQGAYGGKTSGTMTAYGNRRSGPRVPVKFDVDKDGSVSGTAYFSGNTQLGPAYVDAKFAGAVSRTGQLGADGAALVGRTRSDAANYQVSLTGSISGRVFKGEFLIADTAITTVTATRR